MKNTYANIQAFGQSTCQPCVGTNDPLTYCLVDTMDKSFQHGSTADLYGPRSNKCQAYMAERCAQKWDGACEYFYREHGPNGQWPNNQYWPNTQQNNVFGPAFNTPQTMGEQLLQNTSMRKYCSMPTCDKVCEPFDPLNPNSPTITYYKSRSYNGQGCVPICNVKPTEIDQDPVMDRMLANPRANAAVLINICNTAQRNGTDLSGTKLGGFCQRYHQQLQK